MKSKVSLSNASNIKNITKILTNSSIITAAVVLIIVIVFSGLLMNMNRNMKYENFVGSECTKPNNENTVSFYLLNKTNMNIFIGTSIGIKSCPLTRANIKSNDTTLVTIAAPGGNMNIYNYSDKCTKANPLCDAGVLLQSFELTKIPYDTSKRDSTIIISGSSGAFVLSPSPP
jgi:hypothetical protein